MIDWIRGLLVICILGLAFGIGFLLVPLCRLIDYKRDYKRLCKKYGKEVADEFARLY